MKPLAIWLAIVAVVFGGYVVITAATRTTTQVFVFVDSSNPMSGAIARKVPRELDRIDDREHAEFALAEGHRNLENLVHTYQPTLDIGTFQPFAPCSFAKIDSFPEAAEADEKILITTRGSTSNPECDTSLLVGWDVIELSP